MFPGDVAISTFFAEPLLNEPGTLLACDPDRVHHTPRLREPIDRSSKATGGTLVFVALALDRPIEVSLEWALQLNWRDGGRHGVGPMIINLRHK